MVVERPDLVVLDTTLPDIDGIEVLQYMRKFVAIQDFPVIMLPLKGTHVDVSRDWQGPFDCCLTKPFNPMELISFVKRIFAKMGYEGYNEYDEIFRIG